MTSWIHGRGVYIFNPAPTVLITFTPITQYHTSFPSAFLISSRPAFILSILFFAHSHMIVILSPLLCPHPLPRLQMSHLSFVIYHVPDDLEVPQVIIAQQLVLLGGVEQREVFHDDGCSNSKRY